MSEGEINTCDAMHMLNQGKVLVNGEWVEDER